MKRNHLLLRRKICALTVTAVSALFLSSCAQDGFDDGERWKSDVTNTTLENPAVEDITIEASTDGTQTIISWPVVHGAGGYVCSVYDVSDAEKPVAVDEVENKLIDACRLVVSRAEDTNYMFAIQTAGNDELNNKAAETTAEIAFTSFTEAYGSIPAGSDIASWFESNPIAEDATGELCFDLEAGGEYTLSKDLDFGNKQVTLRTTNKANPATVSITAPASIITSTGLVLKYVNFDCAGSTEPLIKLSETPDPDILGATGTGDYYNIMLPITINGCEISNMRGTLYYDNKVKYCAGVLLITNSIIHFNLDGEGKIYEQALISAYGGHINNFTLQNSTVYNTGTDATANYFIRYNNSGRCDRAGYLADYVNYRNSTLYNVVKNGQMANYSALQGRASSNYTVTNCIFVDCGSNQVARRIVAGRVGSGKATFANNTYMYDGAFETTAGYDDSGTNIEEDPGFANPANGDFTVSGTQQISLGTGDPRWLPSNE